MRKNALLETETASKLLKKCQLTYSKMKNEIVWLSEEFQKMTCTFKKKRERFFA